MNFLSLASFVGSIPSACGSDTSTLLLSADPGTHQHLRFAMEPTKRVPAAYSESANPLTSLTVAAYTSGKAPGNMTSPAWVVPLTVRLTTETPALTSLE